MTVKHNTAGAPGGAAISWLASAYGPRIAFSPDEGAPAAPAPVETSPMSLDDVVAQMNEREERQEEPEGRSNGAPNDEPEGKTQAEDEPSREDEPQSDEDPPETDEEEGEPEAGEDDEQDIVHGNVKTRLRDGTVVAIADLKKSHAELQDLKRQGKDTASERKALDETKAQLQQRQKQLEEVLPHALRIAQASIPAEPDQALMESDPIEFFSQQHKRALAIAEFQKVEGAAKAEAEAKQKEQQAQFKEYADKERAALVDRVPDLKDEAKAKAFYADVISTAEHYGFAKEDVDGAMDHRLWLLMKDASAYRKLQAAKPKAMEKAKNAVPVQPAGRRQAPAERRGANEQAAWDKLGKSGDLDDAVAFLNQRQA